MNGLKIQFETVTPASNQLDFSFPIAFSVKCIACLAINCQDMYIGTSSLADITRTGFKVDTYRGTTTKQKFTYIAIGY